MPEETLCQEVRVRVASLATSHQNKYSDVSGSVSGMFAGLSLLVCFLYVLDRKLQIDQDANTWKIQGELQRFKRGEIRSLETWRASKRRSLPCIFGLSHLTPPPPLSKTSALGIPLECKKSV